MGNRIKGYMGNLHKFYLFQTFDHISFGYVLGMKEGYAQGYEAAIKEILPTARNVEIKKISNTHALESFLEKFNLCEDVYCFDNARMAFYRILKSLKDKEMGVVEDDEEEE